MLFAFTDVTGIRLCRWALRVCLGLKLSDLLLAVFGGAYPGVGWAARATEDRLLVYCGPWCCFACNFRAFNAERRKTARGDDGNLSIEYGLWRRKCFRQGARCFAAGLKSLVSDWFKLSGCD